MRVIVRNKETLEFFKKISQLGDVALPFKVYGDVKVLKIVFTTLTAKYDLDLNLLEVIESNNDEDNTTLIIPSTKKLVKFFDVLKEVGDNSIIELIETDYKILKISDVNGKSVFYTLLAEDDEIEFKPINLEIIKQEKVIEFLLDDKVINSILKVLKTIDSEECKFIIDSENKCYFEIGSVLSSEFSRVYLEDVNFEEIKNEFFSDEGIETEYVKLSIDVEDEEKEQIVITLNKEELTNTFSILKDEDGNIRFNLLKNGLLTFLNNNNTTKIAILPEIGSV